MVLLCFHTMREGGREAGGRAHKLPTPGESFKFRDEEDLWLMNRKVSINQVVVEVNYVVWCKNNWETEWIPWVTSKHTTPILHLAMYKRDFM